MAQLFFILFALGAAGCGSDRDDMESPEPGGASGGSSGAGGSSGETGGGEPGGTGGTGAGGEPIAGGGGENGGSGGTGGGPFDLTGLIATSGSHIVFESDTDRSFQKQIFVIDLESNEVHTLHEGSAQIDSVDVSPDRRTLLFGNSDAASASNLFVVRSVESGVVPVAPVSGFEGRPAEYRLQGWTGDGRFAIYGLANNLVAESIDVVDTWSNALHDTLAADSGHAHANAWTAPAGAWFAFQFDSNGGGQSRSSLARITDEGVENEEIEGFRFSGFSPDGTRVVYDTGGNTAERPYVRRDLPSGAPIALTPQPFEAFELDHVVAFSLDRDHAIGQYRDEAVGFVWRRLDLTSGESTALHEAEYLSADLYPFAAGEELLFVHTGESDFTVGLSDATGERPFETVETFAKGLASDNRFGALGARHAYYGAASIGITLVARDDAGVVQRANVLPSSTDVYLCGDAQRQLPEQRAAFHMLNESGVALIDHSEPLARLGATLEAQHDGLLSCPVWNEGGDALAFVESVDNIGETHSWIYVVRWPAGGDPEAPQLVHEADAVLDVLLARP